MTHDPCTVLMRLVQAAEAFVAGRGYAVPRADVDELRELVAADIATPAPDGRYVGDLESLLAQAMQLAAGQTGTQQGDPERRRCLLSLIGLLLPQVQLANSRAINARREGRL
jgi:hypothetical protein